MSDASTVQNVSQQEAELLLEDLVRIESYSGVERKASAFLASWLGERGFASFVDESDSANGIRGPKLDEHADVTITLLGHIDTVPGLIPVRVDEDRVLHGRGSVDAKGSLCTFAAAACNASLPESVRLVVLGCTEEEAASSKGSRSALNRYTPDACVIGEPSAWEGITLGYKGRLLADYELTIPWSHSAGPDPSAIDRGMAWWARVQEFAERFNVTEDGDQRGPFTSLQASVREVNSFNNGLNDSVRLHCGFRLPPDLAPATLEAKLRDLLDDVYGSQEIASLVCTGREFAHRSPRTDAVARALRVAIRQHGGTPVPKVKTGTSDMNVVAPVWDCPIVAYGPGDSALDHTPEERQSLDEYWKAVQVLTTAIEVLANELVQTKAKAVVQAKAAEVNA